MLVWPARLALLALVQVAESSQETLRVASARFSHVGDAATSSAHSKKVRRSFLRRFSGKDAFARSKSIAIIPQPKNMEVVGGDDLVFHSGALRLSVPSTVESDAFCEHVIGKTNLKVDAQVDLPQIILEVQRDPQPEKYTFSVSSEKNEVRITGSTSHGLFNGLMTLRQLFVQGDAGEWRLPQVKIRDEPEHEWRGLMLDVSRHFFNASEVKHLLRTMASFKMNRFHWHLSDDQGWRIPSQKYPKLTEVGAWREGTQIGHSSTHDHVRYGGSYTADEMRSIVAYAKSLHIEIIPEIDSPGHIQAVLAAYPELGNVGAKVATQFGALEHTMKPSETSMHFISDVIGETAQLVDSDYFHVGGDEVATQQWSRSAVARDFMESHRLRNVEGIAGVMTQNAIHAVKHLGRQAVVWDDAMHNGVALPRDTVVMLWRSWMGVKNLAQQAAEQGHAVVMCPQDRTYLDQFQSPNGNNDAFGAIGGFLNTRKVYELDFNGHGAKVLGGQGQLWSEYITGGVRDLDYKAWPRGAALAEATWSGRHRPGFGDFQRRLQLLRPELRGMQVNFRDADGQQALSTLKMPKAIEVHHDRHSGLQVRRNTARPARHTRHGDTQALLAHVRSVASSNAADASKRHRAVALLQRLLGGSKGLKARR